MRKWLPFTLIIVAFAASSAVYQRLPDRVPTHWNLAGEVDGWSSRPMGAFLLPFVLVGMYTMLWLGPKIDPLKANYVKFRSTYETLVVTMMSFLLGLHLLVLATALQREVSMARVLPFALGTVFIVIGNLLPRTRPNWFIGVRTPWTMSSEYAWTRTHRLSGRLFVAAGLLTILAGLFAPTQAMRVLFGSLALSSIAALVYSYVSWKTDPKSGTPVWLGGRHH